MHEAAFQYLKSGTVELGNLITVAQFQWLLDEAVHETAYLLRELSLPEIKSQIVGKAILPEEFGSRRAMMVYATGSEPWPPDESIQYWFIERGGNWIWIKATPDGSSVDCEHVTSRHYAQRFRDEIDDTVSVTRFSTFCYNIRKQSDKAADAADEREKRIRAISRKFQSKIDRIHSLD